MDWRVNMVLVEDNELDTVLFSRAVKKSRLDVLLKTLTSGHQAIEYLEAKGSYADRLSHPLPDVIVLDLKMPGLNGFDFLAWRKVSGLFMAIPVVVFSGSTNQAEIDHVFELGANKRVPKPDGSGDWETVVQEIYDFTVDGTTFFPKTSGDQPQPEETPAASAPPVSPH